MLRMTFVFVLLSTLLAAPAFAIAVKLEGIGSQSTPRGDASNGSFAAETGIGGGAELSIPFGTNMSFDFGALYLQRKYKTTLTSGIFNGTSQIATQTALEIPVLMRLWLGRVFSIGVGGYYMKYMGDIALSTTFANATSATASTSTYAAASQSTSDYGATVAVGLDIPMGLVTGLVIDGRYNYGLKNQVTTGSSIKFSDMQGFVGLRFGMNMMK